MDAIEEVKSRLAIEDVVGEYVQLKRAGRNWKGLSPFTSERTPSFVVSPEKGIWHDFSSGKGGNVFSFVMEMEGLDFKEALELLARKANVDLSQYQSSRSGSNAQLKDRLYEILDVSTKFYQAQLRGSEVALKYVLGKRAFTKDTVLAYRIGYSPNTGDALAQYLLKQGFNEDEIQRAGLSAQRRYGGVHDMFRGRLMIPLMDAQGRVIGFTARILEDDPQAPKYINTPQTILYDKSRHVFGLHLAKESIRSSGFVVMVEGNLDVIASFQAGIGQVVATAGTAITEMHLKTISRFTGDVRLSFDQDRAGLAATERAIPIAGKVGVTLSIITIPEGKDPDELVRRDPELWRTAITQNQYALDWLFQKYQSQLDLSSAQGKREFSDVLLAVVRRLPDEVEQDHYLAEISRVTGASLDALRGKLRGIESTADRPRRKGKVQPQQANSFDVAKIQNHLLSLLLLRPGLRYELVAVTSDMFELGDQRAVYEFLKQNPDFDGDPKVAAELRQVADYVKILGLQYDELYRDREDIDLRVETTYLRIELIKQYVKNQKDTLQLQLSEADDAQKQQLLGQMSALDAMLNDIK